jgi:hypothetical protein
MTCLMRLDCLYNSGIGREEYLLLSNNIAAAMHKFADKTELLIHARQHVEQAVNSLWRDVRQCLRNEFEPAPFPATLYCFSSVDLLGALVSGRAHKNAHTTVQSIQYMTSFMDYSTENATILIDLFRHKLVHLAQPSPLIRYGSEVITWRHHHHNRQFHLKKIPHEQGSETGDVPLDWHIQVTHEFNISIMDFAKDIKDSAMGPNGYFDILQNCPYLQAKYELAINQILGEATLAK